MTIDTILNIKSTEGHSATEVNALPRMILNRMADPPGSDARINRGEKSLSSDQRGSSLTNIANGNF